MTPVCFGLILQVRAERAGTGFGDHGVKFSSSLIPRNGMCHMSRSAGLSHSRSTHPAREAGLFAGSG